MRSSVRHVTDLQRVRELWHNRAFCLSVKISIVLLSCYAAACLLLVMTGLTDRLGRADLAVVPGNKVERSGRPSKRLAARLDRAIEIYKGGYCAAILVSGGIGREGYDEAQVMKTYLQTAGIPAGAIVVDSEGIDTWSTARNTAAFMTSSGMHTCIIVTQYFHVARTRLALKKFGISAPYSARARIFELRDLYSIPREVIGYIRYLVHG